MCGLCNLKEKKNHNVIKLTYPISFLKGTRKQAQNNLFKWHKLVFELIPPILIHKPSEFKAKFI